MPLNKGRIRLTGSGWSLLLFCFGLISSAIAVGANLLLLMDFFLFSALLFNYFYLVMVRRGAISLKPPNYAYEDSSAQWDFSYNNLPPVFIKLLIHASRFNKEGTSFEAGIYLSGKEKRIHSFSFPARGLWNVQDISIHVSYPFPLFELCLTREAHFEIISWPRPGEVHSALYPQYGLRHSEDEYSHLRAYLPGDPLKKVSWKGSARAGKLMVRESEPVEKITRTAFVLDYTEKNEKKVFSLAAGLLLALLREQQMVSIISATGEVSFHGESEQEALLTALALYEKPRHFISGAGVLDERVLACKG